MSLLDQPHFKPDDELRAFIEEYEDTRGRMYQDRNPNRAQADNQSVRPKYYGRRPTNSLRSTRVRRILTQPQLAARSGTTKRTIVAIEAGRREPSVYLAIALAQALDAQVEDIFHLPYLTPVPPSRH